MNAVMDYISKIRNGEIVTSKKVKQLYFDIIEPIMLGNDKKYHFDEKKAKRFVLFAEKLCKQSKGKWAGKYVKLCLFQKAKWESIFGIVDKNGKRRFQEVFDVRGRKNGKSEEGAIAGLYLTVSEPGAEVYVAATTQAQARRMWEEAQTIIDQDYDMSEAFGYKVFPTPTIYTKGRAIKSSFKVLSHNVRTFDGLNASGAIIDEIHELPRNIYDILKQSMTTREQPLLSMITTAGFVRGGLFDDEYEYSKRVLNGEIEDDSLFPLIYELDDPSEVNDENAWVKANPGLDLIKPRKTLKEYVERSKVDLNFAASVYTKEFNIIGVSEKMGFSFEEIKAGEYGPYSEEEVGTDETDPRRAEFLKKFDNTVAVGGFDLSQSSDFSAFITLLFDSEKNAIVVIPDVWTTRKFVESDLARRSRVPFGAWIKRGLLHVSKTDDLIDYGEMADVIMDHYNNDGWIYQSIGYDPYNSSYLVSQLKSLGFSDGCLTKVRQGFLSLGEPVKTLKEMLTGKRITYLNNPVFKWAMSNVEMVPDRNGNLMPKKMNDDQSKKIDPVAAALDAIFCFLENPEYYLQ